MNLTRAQRAHTTAEVLKNLYPDPTIELFFTNPFTFLVAVILSAQSQDIQVNKVTPRLFAAISTPADVLALGEEKLRDYIKTLGLYKNKAAFITKLSQRLVDDFEGLVPSDRESLESLPGVGRKTANVFLNHIHALPTIAIDTHVFRVAKRLELSGQETPWGVEQDLMDLFLQEDHLLIGLRLVLFGRYCCKALKPQCASCPLNEFCPYYAASKRVK